MHDIKELRFDNNKNLLITDSNRTKHGIFTGLYRNEEAKL